MYNKYINILIMTDMQDLSAQTLPIHMKFSEMTPLAVSAVSKRTKFLPTTGHTYSQLNNILRIPLSSALDFVDGSGTLLKFKYQNLSGQTICMDGSAHSVIQTLRLISTTSGVMIHAFVQTTTLCLKSYHIKLHKSIITVVFRYQL